MITALQNFTQLLKQLVRIHLTDFIPLFFVVHFSNTSYIHALCYILSLHK